MPDLDILKTARNLTLVVLFYKLNRYYFSTQSHPFWYLHLAIVLFAVIGLVVPRLQDARSFWFGLLAIFGSHVFASWELVDNHNYLITYWVVALTIVSCLPPEERVDVMRFNARWLIGLCMIFAVIGKAKSMEYLDGSFVNYYLLFERKFFGLAYFFGGRGGAELLEGYSARNAAIDSPASFEYPLVAANTSRMYIAAMGVTWGGIILEAIVGILFILPEKSPLAKVRDLSLYAFILGLYSFVSVLSFSWILITLGFAQAKSKRARQLYLFLLLYVLFISRFLLNFKAWVFYG